MKIFILLLRALDMDPRGPKMLVTLSDESIQSILVPGLSNLARQKLRYSYSHFNRSYLVKRESLVLLFCSPTIDPRGLKTHRICSRECIL